jgi:wobble nucleotide-excising tRNase
MKILISEYEKKIRDLEKAKVDDRETIECLEQEIESKRLAADNL